MDTCTIDQIREDVKAKWRSCETIEQFSKLANLEPAMARHLESDYIGHTENVQRYIRELAITFYNVVKSFIEENQWKDIQCALRWCRQSYYSLGQSGGQSSRSSSVFLLR